MIRAQAFDNRLSLAEYVIYNQTNPLATDTDNHNAPPALRAKFKAENAIKRQIRHDMFTDLKHRSTAGSAAFRFIHFDALLDGRQWNDIN